ncbi:MAG: PIN domain-containing protein [Saprospiraceae bacterium]
MAGDETLAKFLQNKQLYLSIISELELLSFKKLSRIETAKIKSFIEELIIVNITQEIKSTVIELRKTSKLKLPDCIIAVTSISLAIPLFSSDKQLRTIERLDLILHEG